MVFRSKVDTWLVLVLVAAAAATLVAAGAGLRQVSGATSLVLLVVVALSLVLPAWILTSTNYVIESSILHIRSGPFAWRIPVSSITSITPTTSPVSSPALSLKRLRVEYGAGKRILVSPADPQAFVRAIEGAKNAA